MNDEKEVYELTRAGYEEKKARLAELKGPITDANLLAIKEAREQGDLSENSDYKYAREEQTRIVAEIAEIENILKYAKILDITKVKVEYVDLKKTYDYEIVGTIEADPFNKKISNDSPLGKAISEHKKGDVFFITTEAGKELKIKLLEKK